MKITAYGDLHSFNSIEDQHWEDHCVEQITGTLLSTLLKINSEVSDLTGGSSPSITLSTLLKINRRNKTHLSSLSNI